MLLFNDIFKKTHLGCAHAIGSITRRWQCSTKRFIWVPHSALVDVSTRFNSRLLVTETLKSIFLFSIRRFRI